MATAMRRVDRIAAEARQLQFGRALLMVIASPFFAIGWLIGKGWLVVTWCLAAIKVGWQDARAN